MAFRNSIVQCNGKDYHTKVSTDFKKDGLIKSNDTVHTWANSVTDFIHKVSGSIEYFSKNGKVLRHIEKGEMRGSLRSYRAHFFRMGEKFCY